MPQNGCIRNAFATLYLAQIWDSIYHLETMPFTRGCHMIVQPYLLVSVVRDYLKLGALVLHRNQSESN